MKRLFGIVLLSLLVSGPAFADSAAVKNLMGLGMPGELAGEIDKNYAGAGGTSGALSTTGSVIFRNATGTPVAWVTPSTGGFVSTSGDVTFQGAGKQPVYPAAAIITPATSFPTPGAGGDLTARFTRIAAGAPTAAFVQLPRATANVGKTYSVVSLSSNPVAIVPISGDSQGAAAAATPYSCTAGKFCSCTALTTALWGCGLQ